MMKQTTLNYQDGNTQLCGQFIVDPSKNYEQLPAIIVFPAFEGISSFALGYGKHFAEQGYAVLVADMYGDGKVATTLSECFDFISPFLQDRNLVRRRAELAFHTLSSQEQVNKNKIGAIGFCFGGMCALEVARSGANLAAITAVHAVLKKSSLPNKIHCQHFLVLHGYQDPQVPPDSLQEFAAEMEAAHISDWSFLFFGHAQHSFTDPKTGSFDAQKEEQMGRAYDAVAAKRALHYATDFFDEILR